MPLVSVVIPTCNRPDLVVRALRSVLAQSFRDFEIIVIDDGVKERAEEVVRGMNCDRIRYYQNRDPRGGAAARNRGIAEARGSLIAFLDDDDEWMPEKLGIQVQALSEAPHDVGFSATAVMNVFDTHERATSIEEGVADFSEISLRRFKGFLTSTLLVKREVFKEVGGFDESLPSHQEAELLIRITRRHRGLGLNTPLTRMNMSSSREHIGGNMGRRITGKEMVLRKHAALFNVRPTVLAQHLFWLALWYRDVGRLSDARAALRRAWTLDRRARYALHFLFMTVRSLWA